MPQIKSWLAFNDVLDIEPRKTPVIIIITRDFWSDPLYTVSPVACRALHLWRSSFASKLKNARSTMEHSAWGTFKAFNWKRCDIVFRQTRNQGLGRAFFMSGIGVLYVFWQSLLLRLMGLWEPCVFFQKPSSISVNVTSIIVPSWQRNPKDRLNIDVTTTGESVFSVFMCVCMCRARGTYWIWFLTYWLKTHAN